MSLYLCTRGTVSQLASKGGFSNDFWIAVLCWVGVAKGFAKSIDCMSDAGQSLCKEHLEARPV
jgi:hypothetical protein